MAAFYPSLRRSPRRAGRGERLGRSSGGDERRHGRGSRRGNERRACRGPPIHTVSIRAPFCGFAGHGTRSNGREGGAGRPGTRSGELNRQGRDCERNGQVWSKEGAGRRQRKREEDKEERRGGERKEFCALRSAMLLGLAARVCRSGADVEKAAPGGQRGVGAASYVEKKNKMLTFGGRRRAGARSKVDFG